MVFGTPLMARNQFDMNLQVTALNLLILNELKHAVRALKNAGITPMILKGAALVSTVYEDISLRPMQDADILIRPEDLAKARSALEAAGFTFIPDRPQRFGPFDTVFAGESSYRRANRPAIDLHWEAMGLEWMRRTSKFAQEQFWEEALEIRLDGESALQLSPRDMLLHLCIHLAQHSYAHPVGYEDIRRVLSRCQPFPWDRFLERARAFEIRAMCYFALAAGSEIFAIPVPRAVLDALRPPAWQIRLVDGIANPRLAALGKLALSPGRDYLLHLSVADRPAAVIRFLAWLFVPGPAWLMQRYRLRNRFQAALACFWHPWVVIAKGLSGAKAILFNR